MAPRNLPLFAVALAAGSIALTACSSDTNPVPTLEPTSETSRPSEACTNYDRIASWTLDERLTQVLMGAVSTDQGAEAMDQAVQALTEGSVGGVNFLGSDASAFTTSDLAEVVEASGDLPPLLAVDEEGGRVQRLRSIVGTVPSAREMTSTMTPKQVRAVGRRIGQTMHDLSLNMDLAPVVDVGTQAIGDRSFSDDPDVVTKYAGAFAAGLRGADVIPTLKHFPGLGSATGNTDFGAATTPPLSELRKSDLKPYVALLDEQPVTVMFANAVVPGLTEGAPASLSPAAYELLRDDLGFDGVAITDSLSAVAISNINTVPEAVEKALAAGADIALWDDLAQADAVRARLKKAVKKGRLSEDRINEAVTRIVALKGADLCSRG